MKLKNITIKTDDTEVLHRFYGNILELPCERKNGVLTVKAGESTITFEEDDTGAYYHFAFNIPYGQIPDALAWVERRTHILPYRGNKIVNFKAWDAKALYFTDPAGNILEFIGRKPAGIPDDDEFNSSSLKNVSEIGLATNNVKYWFDRLNSQYGVPFYSGNMTGFCAAGTAHGLFIIVKAEDKKWMPTTIPAKSFPVKAEIEEEGKRIKLEFHG